MSVINTVDKSVFGDAPLRTLSFEKVSGSSLVRQELAGIYVNGANRGKVDRYDEATADMKFLGLVVGTSSTNTNAVKVQFEGFTAGFAGNVSVAGSGSSKPGDPVYANGYDAGSLSAAKESGQPDQEQVGVLFEQAEASSLFWSVIMLPSSVRSAGQKPVIGPKGTTITADGAIPQATYGHNGAYVQVTGAASAELTLADPIANEVGNVIRIHRLGGSGTHNVDFNDEAGSAVTVTIADGAVVVLQAVSTSGYRQIGS